MNHHDHFDLERRLVAEARQFQDRPTRQADPDALQREASRRRRRSRTATSLVVLVVAVSVGTAIHFGMPEPNRPAHPVLTAQAPLSIDQPADGARLSSPNAPHPQPSPRAATPDDSEPVEYVVAIPDGNQLRVIGRLIYPAGQHGPPKREELASLLPLLAVRRSVGFGELSVVQQMAVRQLFGTDDSTPARATF